jgi:hypothetical protein
MKLTFASLQAHRVQQISVYGHQPISSVGSIHYHPINTSCNFMAAASAQMVIMATPRVQPF